MFGTEPLTDFLITIVVIQTALIAFLITIILFKINKSNNHSTTDKINNELSKKISSLDTKVSLISSEFSQGVKENAESISKLLSTVNTTSDSTSTALAEANSSLSSLSESLSGFPNPTMTSGLFEHSIDRPFLKSEFLKIDDMDPGQENDEEIDIDSNRINPRIVQNINSSNNGDTEEVTSSAQNQETRVLSPSLHNPDSKTGLTFQPDHSVHPKDNLQSEKHGIHQQSTDKVEEEEKEGKELANPPLTTSNQSQEFDIAVVDIQSKLKTVGENTGNQVSDYKNDEDIPDSNPKSQAPDNKERNSNPEIDKLDFEILSALKRLGGMDEAIHDEQETARKPTDDNDGGSGDYKKK